MGEGTPDLGSSAGSVPPIGGEGFGQPGAQNAEVIADSLMAQRGGVAEAAAPAPAADSAARRSEYTAGEAAQPWAMPTGEHSSPVGGDSAEPAQPPATVLTSHATVYQGNSRVGETPGAPTEVSSTLVGTSGVPEQPAPDPNAWLKSAVEPHGNKEYRPIGDTAFSKEVGVGVAEVGGRQTSVERTDADIRAAAQRVYDGFTTTNSGNRLARQTPFMSGEAAGPDQQAQGEMADAYARDQARVAQQASDAAAVIGRPDPTQSKAA